MYFILYGYLTGYNSKKIKNKTCMIYNLYVQTKASSGQSSRASHAAMRDTPLRSDRKRDGGSNTRLASVCVACVCVCGVCVCGVCVWCVCAVCVCGVCVWCVCVCVC